MTRWSWEWRGIIWIKSYFRNKCRLTRRKILWIWKICRRKKFSWKIGRIVWNSRRKVWRIRGVGLLWLKNRNKNSLRCWKRMRICLVSCREAKKDWILTSVCLISRFRIKKFLSFRCINNRKNNNKGRVMVRSYNRKMMIRKIWIVVTWGIFLRVVV